MISPLSSALAATLWAGAPAPEAHAVPALVDRRLHVDDAHDQVLCTATLIGPQTLLTAGHCVASYGRGTQEVLFGASLDDPDAIHRQIVATQLHPSYSPSASANDLGLVWLDEPVAFEGVAVFEGELDPSVIGPTLGVVGFAEGLRWRGEVLLDNIEPGEPGAPGTLRYLPGPDMTCAGDSGGPVFTRIAATNEDQLVGITSAGDLSCEAFGVAAAVDPSFLATPAPPTSDTVLGFDQLCEVECWADADCPGDLVCDGDGTGLRRCSIRGLEPGTLGEACTADAACGGGDRCVALGGAGRCLSLCDELTDEPEPDAADGCRVTGADPRPGRSPIPVTLMIVLAAVGLRPRPRPGS